MAEADFDGAKQCSKHAPVASPDNAADVMSFDKHAAELTRSNANHDSTPTAAGNNHGAAADRVSEYRLRKYPWSTRCPI